MTEATAAWRQIERARHVRPTDRKWLWDWVRLNTGVRIPHTAVCKGHSAPLDMFARQVIERPDQTLWHAPRGSGKSFLSAIDTHICSRFHPGFETRILGGSLAQSEQIQRAVREAVIDGKGPHGHSDKDTIRDYQKRNIYYHNGSEISILAASPTSVRGPHVPSLKLDEVDEIEPDIRESAYGMAMEKRGYRSSILMTSTWHRVDGPMAELIKKAEEDNSFRVESYCVFEVLERCPEDRSGPNLEKCPECPLMAWCHAGRDEHPSGLPKAKRSSGHYTINSLIQKVCGVSGRVFESDYLCLRPKAAGLWFTTWDSQPGGQHIRESAEYDPRWPVHLAIDCGVHTGAVWFQRRPNYRGGWDVNVFADYYYESDTSDTAPPEKNARAILEISRRLCGGARVRVSMDSAGNSRNGAGPIVRGEYERVGVKGPNGIESWIQTPGSVRDSLQLVESLLKSADGSVSLTVHPRCRKLIEAFATYRRAKRGNSWQDDPEPNQHSAEDLIDPLRCGLKLEAPEGRTPPMQGRQVHASRFH